MAMSMSDYQKLLSAVAQIQELVLQVRTLADRVEALENKKGPGRPAKEAA